MDKCVQGDMMSAEDLISCLKVKKRPIVEPTVPNVAKRIQLSERPKRKRARSPDIESDDDDEHRKKPKKKTKDGKSKSGKPKKKKKTCESDDG